MTLPPTYGAEAADPKEVGSNRFEPPPPPEPAAPAEPPAHEPEPAPPELQMLPAPKLPGSVGGLLQKAGDYVVRYEQAFRNVVALEDAEERYDDVGTKYFFARKPDGRVVASPQGEVTRTTRRLRSEIAFTMLPGPVPWVAFRDVLQVDGRTVREGGRLERVFRDSPSAAVEPASAISRDSRRYSLGPPNRTAIVPTMALAYLHPDNRDRFTFERKSTQGGAEVEVAFTEVGRPALVQDTAGADMPAHGRILLREDDGAVLRTEVEFRSAGVNGGSLRVTTEYRPDSALALLVPAEMTELYEATVDVETSPVSGRVAAPLLKPATDGLATTARYSGFHRFGGEDGAKP